MLFDTERIVRNGVGLQTIPIPTSEKQKVQAWALKEGGLPALSMLTWREYVGQGTMEGMRTIGIYLPVQNRMHHGYHVTLKRVA